MARARRHRAGRRMVKPACLQTSKNATFACIDACQRCHHIGSHIVIIGTQKTCEPYAREEAALFKVSLREHALLSVLVGLQRGVQPETSHLKHALIEDGLALSQDGRLSLSDAGSTLLQALQHMVWAEVESLQQVLANKSQAPSDDVLRMTRVRPNPTLE